jgi:phosphatidylglycerophosphate synthase
MTITLDYAAAAAVASMKVGGMTVVERVLREAAATGVTAAVVRLDASHRPRLPALPIAVEWLDAAAPLASAAELRPGTVIAGVTISDRRTRHRAERALLETCRRSYDGIGDRYVIRPVSLRLTPHLARVGATPNQVTIANTVLGVIACTVVASGSRRGLAAGGVAIWLQVVLDSCDGELARIRYLYSAFGRTLDNVSDDVIDNGFVAALGFAIGGAWWPIALAAVLARASCAIMIFRAVARIGRPGDVMAFRWFFDRPSDELAQRFERTITPLAVVRALGRRDLYVLVWASACIAQVPVVGLVLGLAVGFGYFGLSMVHRIARARATDRTAM